MPCSLVLNTFLYPSSFVGRMARLFYLHGKFCASHPWEVMVTFLSLAICMFTMGPYVLFDQSHGPPTNSPMASPEMYFSQMDHTAHPHLPPDSYNSKSANYVSEDLTSQNRYFHALDQSGQQTVQQRHCAQSNDCSRQVSLSDHIHASVFTFVTIGCIEKLIFKEW